MEVSIPLLQNEGGNTMSDVTEQQFQEDWASTIERAEKVLFREVKEYLEEKNPLTIRVYSSEEMKEYVKCTDIYHGIKLHGVKVCVHFCFESQCMWKYKISCEALGIEEIEPISRKEFFAQGTLIFNVFWDSPYGNEKLQKEVSLWKVLV